MKNVAILGFGTVGSGVYEMLCQNAEKIEKALGYPLKVKYILDIRDFSDREDAHIFTKDFNVILEDPEVDIVAEVIGGINPAYDFTKAALMSGKSVVTSNKELVAKKGCELLAIAKEKNINYLFEASVGGGIPLINPVNNCLAPNKIEEIGGILNGTTNYILTEMFEKGRGFEEALKNAQELGYAERNPSADVDGIDTKRKISILMSLITGSFVDSEKIYAEGITKIDSDDVKYAESLNKSIKLIGYGYTEGEKIYAAVCPTMIDNKEPLSSINGVYNGVKAYGNAVMDVMFYGRGAGMMPTASAVVADIFDIAKDTKNKNYFWEDKGDVLIPYNVAKETYFVRVEGSDKKAVEEIFGAVSFAEIKEGEFAFIAPLMTNEEFNNKAKSIPMIKKIRVMGESK